MDDMASAAQGSRVPAGTPGLWGQSPSGVMNRSQLSIGASPRLQGNNIHGSESGMRRREFVFCLVCRLKRTSTLQ